MWRLIVSDRVPIFHRVYGSCRLEVCNIHYRYVVFLICNVVCFGMQGKTGTMRLPSRRACGSSRPEAAYRQDWYEQVARVCTLEGLMISTFRSTKGRERERSQAPSLGPDRGGCREKYSKVTLKRRDPREAGKYALLQKFP